MREKLLRTALLASLLLFFGSSLKATVYFVDSSATLGANNGTSWANAFLQLKSATSIALSGDTVKVAKGTYFPSYVGDITQSFSPGNGVIVMGGFPNGGGANSTRNWITHPTILSGDIGVKGDSLDNSYHVCFLSSTATLDGFIIEKGHGRSTGNNRRGGGVFISAASSTIRNCVIRDNSVTDAGAGLYAQNAGANPIITNCIFYRNRAVARGGAVNSQNTGCVVTMRNCTFFKNVATNGSAIANQSSGTTVLTNCIVWGNRPRNSQFFTPTSSTISFSITMGGVTGTNLLNVYPLFVDTLTYDLRIRLCSPAVDAGTNTGAPARDFANAPRPFDGNGDATATTDIGAYETQSVGAPPVVTFAGLSPVICLNQGTANLTGNNAPGGVFSSIPPTAGLVDNANGTATFNPVVAGQDTFDIIYFYSDPNSCQNADTQTVIVSPVPTVSITPFGSTTFCQGGSVTFTGTTGGTYQWYRNAVPIGGATSNVYVATTSGRYNMVRTQAGCSDSAAAGIKVTVNPLPVVTISPAGPDTICPGSSILLTGTAGSSRQWYKNGAILSGQTGTTLNVTTTGWYNLIVTDGNSCMDSAAVGNHVFVGDIEPPVAACRDVTLFLNAAGNATLTTGAVNNGSTDNCAVGALSLSQTAFTCSDLGVNSVTLTVNDVNGNSSTCNSNITTEDTLAPIAVCNNLSAYLDGTGNALVTPAGIGAGSSDNCGISSQTLDISSFTCPDTGTVMVTLTLMDASGNSSTCMSTVSIFDTLSPVATCQDITLFLNGAGNASTTAANANAGSSDNCGLAGLSLSQTAFTCLDLGVNAETLTVTDVSGNSKTCQSNITVNDTISPVALCLDDTLVIQAGGIATVIPANLDGGSTDNCGISTVNTNISTFACVDTGANPVTVYFMDAFGNVDSCFSTITVLDTFPVAAICADTTIFLDNSGNASVTAYSIGYQTTGNCGISAMYLSDSLFTCVDTGATQLVTLTVVAGSGNDSCQASITVVDATPPTALCQDATLYLNHSGIAKLDPSTVDNGSFDNCGLAQIALSDSSWACVDSGSFTLVFTATDASGLQDTCHVHVSVIDSTSPRAICGTGPETLDQSLTTFDTQVGGVAIAQSFVPAVTGYLSRIRVNTRTANFPDSVTFEIKTGLNPAGTNVIASKRLLIDDAVFVFTDIIFPNSPVMVAGNPYILVITTDADTNLVLVGAKSTGTAYLPGEAWADIFGDGNWLNASRDLNFQEFVYPFSTGADTVYLDASGNVPIMPANVDAGSYDNCGLDTIFTDITSLTCNDIGWNLVTLTVIDPGGRQDSCTAFIMVWDTTSPAAACLDTTLYLDASGLASLAAADVNNGSSDNCAIQTLSLNKTSFNCTNTGLNAQILTVTDSSGNVSTCNTSITVLDTIRPQALCLDTTLYLNSGGAASLLAANLNAGGSDNCSLASVVASQTAFSCPDSGLNVITLVFTDASGNTNSCTSNVFVEDTTRPVISCQNLTVNLDPAGNATILAQSLNNGSTDNCGIATYLVDQSSFTCQDTGSNPVMLTITDFSGNQNTCQAFVQVNDNLPPQAVCQSVSLQLPQAGYITIVPNQVDGGSSDNCGIALMTLSQDSFTCANSGANMIMLSVWDGSGNTSTCMAQVTVMDTAGLTDRLVDLGPDSVQCGTDTIMLDAGAGFALYNWSTSEVTQTISIADTGLFSVVVTDIYGCTGSDSVYFGDGIFPANVITQTGNTVLCGGDTVWLTADTGYVSYSWSNGSTAQIIAVTHTGTFTLVALDPGGCGVTETVSVNFQPFPAPNPIILPPGPLDLCAGDTLELDAGAGYFSYLWNTGNTSRYQEVTSAGSFEVTVYNGAGCYATSDLVTVSQLPGPGTPVITQSNDTLYSTPALMYQWFNGGSAIIGATNPFLVPTVSGFYTVQVQDADGCTGKSAVFTLVVGLENGLEETLRVYPNPAMNEVHIDLELFRAEDVSLILTDISGRILNRIDLDHLQNVRETMHLGQLSRGIYFLRIEAGERVWTRKVEKM
ncbi:MAG: T9SS type A sorting domain-containing protein [Bacteroidia bacterium]|nr:T9SS type A sorting domain-containing protein [Bacteroidia bacterium]